MLWGVGEWAYPLSWPRTFFRLVSKADLSLVPQFYWDMRHHPRFQEFREWICYREQGWVVSPENSEFEEEIEVAWPQH